MAAVLPTLAVGFAVIHHHHASGCVSATPGLEHVAPPFHILPCCTALYKDVMHSYTTSARWMATHVLQCPCTVQVDEATVLCASYLYLFVVIHHSADKAVMDASSLPKSGARRPSATRSCFKPVVHNSCSDCDALNKSVRHSSSGDHQVLLETTDEIMSALSQRGVHVDASHPLPSSCECLQL